MTDDERAAELALTGRVGRELVRLGLTSQVAKRRARYAAIRARRTPPTEWSLELTIEWARVLRVPPHAHDYPILRRPATCPACPVSRAFTAMVFPGGSLSKCACGQKWLERDEVKP